MKRTVFLRLGSMVLACLTVCLFAFSAEADAILRAAIDGDQAYVRTLSVIESASLTGTIPFDGDDNPGNDSTAHNRIVRSFDSMQYKLSFEVAAYNQGDAGHQYSQARICFAIVLDAPSSKAEFDFLAMNWIDRTPGYEYRLVEENGVQTLYCSLLMLPKEDTSFVVPGESTVDVAIYVKGMLNGEVLQPKFYAWMEGNDVHADGWEKADGEYTDVLLDKECALHKDKDGQPMHEVAQADGFPVTVSAKMKLNVALTEMLSAGYMEADFNTGNATGRFKAPNYGLGKITGTEMHVGFTVAIQNDTPDKGLRGLEYPDGSPITLDLQFGGYYAADAGGNVPLKGNGYDFTPLLWSVSTFRGVTYTIHEQLMDDGRLVTGYYVLPRARRTASKPESINYACCDGGVITATQEGNVIHLTISDYQIDGTFPITTDPGIPDVRTVPENVGLFATGAMSWVVPRYNQLTDEEILDNYMASVLGDGSVAMSVVEGNLSATSLSGQKLATEPATATGAPGATNQMNAADDSRSVSAELAMPGTYINCVAFVTPNGTSQYQPWTYNCFYNGRDWAYPGADLSILTGLWSMKTLGYPENYVVGFDSFVKIDADAFDLRDQYTGTTDPHTPGLTTHPPTFPGADDYADFFVGDSIPIEEDTILNVLYVTKTDGKNWASEDEMRAARQEHSNLVYHETLSAARGSDPDNPRQIVGFLVQFRGCLSRETAYPRVNVGIRVKETAQLQETYMVTHTLRMWTAGQLAQINANLPAEQRMTTIPVRTATNPGYGYMINETTPTDYTRTIIQGGYKFYPDYQKLVYLEDGSYKGDIGTGYRYGDTMYIMAYKTTVAIDSAIHEEGEPSPVYSLDAGQNVADFRVTPRMELVRLTTGSSSDIPLTTVTMEQLLPAGLDYIADSTYWGGKYVANERYGRQGTVVADDNGFSVKLKDNGSVSYPFTYTDGNQEKTVSITVHMTVNRLATGETKMVFRFENVPLLSDSEQLSAFQHDLFFSTFIQSSSGNGQSSWMLTETVNINGSEEYRQICEENGNLASTSISISQNSAEGLGEVADRIYNEIDAQLGWVITYANNSFTARNESLLFSLMPPRTGNKVYALNGLTIDADASGVSIDKLTLWYTTANMTGKDASSFTAADLANDPQWKTLTLTEATVDGKRVYLPRDIAPAAQATAWILTGPLGGGNAYAVHQTIQPAGNAPGDAYQSAASFRTQAGSALASYATVYVVGREISGVAWYDANRNGVYDAGEQPISGVQMTLYRKNGASYAMQTLDVAGKALPAVTTDANGAYAFTRLPAGSYRVGFGGDALSSYAGLTTWQINGVNDDQTSDAVKDGATGLYLTRYAADAAAIVLRTIEEINEAADLEGSLERVTRQDAGFIKDGSLTVAKRVSGSVPDAAAKYAFTVTFTFNGEPYTAAVPCAIGTVTDTLTPDAAGTVAFSLADGESIVMTGLPAGASYTVAETAPGEGFSVTWEGAVSGTIATAGASVTCVNTFTPASFVPQVRKEIDGHTPPADAVFSFSLAAAADNPEGASLSGTDASVTGAGTASFGAIAFQKSGTYRFTIAETAGSEPGYTYDTAPWTLTVVVEDVNGALQVTSAVYARDGATGEIAVFTNGYEPTGTVYAPSVVKTITGAAPAEAETYAFTLSAEPQEGMTLPEITSVTVTGAGRAQFGEITFSRAGTYTLTITEVPSENPLCVYDASPVTLTVTVADQGGALSVTGVICRKDGRTAASASFTNEYTTPDVPQTGDSLSAALLPLLILSGLMLLWLRRRTA